MHGGALEGEADRPEGYGLGFSRILLFFWGVFGSVIALF
jgi:hypothetical protein